VDVTPNAPLGEENDELIVLAAADVASSLRGREDGVLRAVRGAYELHAEGESVLPHSVFLRPGGQGADRFIGLPAFLGGAEPVAGLKWIASFPGNVARGRERASALIALNSLETGRPRAIAEGSQISAWRTAASAALAAAAFVGGPKEVRVALVGAGPIQRAILRFLSRTVTIAEAVVTDLDPSRADAFVWWARSELPALSIASEPSLRRSIDGAGVVSFATTASTPYVPADAPFASGSSVLHISLRDLPADLVVRHDNVVDDLDHVCREQTSIDLAARLSGHARFVRATLGEILLGRASARASADGVTSFSPFGLGILDLAVFKLALARAASLGLGVRVPRFF